MKAAAWRVTIRASFKASPSMQRWPRRARWDRRSALAMSPRNLAAATAGGASMGRLEIQVSKQHE